MTRAVTRPGDRQYKTVSDKTVGAALLPCTFVTEGASSLTAATAFGPNVRLLINRDFYDNDPYDTSDPLLTAYASGDTGVALVIEPGIWANVAMAAATYTFGQEVTVAAAGRAAGASSTNVVVGFCRFAGAKSAGDLGEIEFCMPYVKA